MTYRRVAIGIAVICDLAGTVWILQGVGVLPGSFMTGKLMWALIGAILIAVSIPLYWLAARRSAS